MRLIPVLIAVSLLGAVTVAWSAPGVEMTVICKKETFKSASDRCEGTEAENHGRYPVNTTFVMSADDPTLVLSEAEPDERVTCKSSRAEAVSTNEKGLLDLFFEVKDITFKQPCTGPDSTHCTVDAINLKYRVQLSRATDHKEMTDGNGDATVHGIAGGQPGVQVTCKSGDRMTVACRYTASKSSPVKLHVEAGTKPRVLMKGLNLKVKGGPCRDRPARFEATYEVSQPGPAWLAHIEEQPEEGRG